MAKAKKKPSRIESFLARAQKREDDARAERRRQLQNGLSRALVHLTDAEMAEIEPVIFGAIGRSIVRR